MKAIILTAGYGTRFLPVTKTIPKEMLPIITKPAIDYIIDEFVESNIKDIIIVNSRRKKSLEDYLDREIELENFFKENNKYELLNKIKTHDINLTFVRQKEMRGTGHAMLQASPFIGSSPYIVAYPDDIIIGDTPISKSLIEFYNKYEKTIMAAQFIENDDLSSYGVFEIGNEVEPNLYEVKRIIEKPPKGQEPSKFISIGRYLYTKEFSELQKKNYENFKGLEFYHVDSLNELANNNKVLCYVFPQKRFDTGTPKGYLELIHHAAINNDDIKDFYKELIKKS